MVRHIKKILLMASISCYAMYQVDVPGKYAYVRCGDFPALEKLTLISPALNEKIIQLLQIKKQTAIRAKLVLSNDGAWALVSDWVEEAPFMEDDDLYNMIKELELAKS